jgi:superfamily II DNA/RNA helicase
VRELVIDFGIGIEQPTSPQNMIGQSQSGTGKTAAFVLTMLSRVDFSKNKTQVRAS